MTDEEFNKYKDALTVKLLEKPKGLMKQAEVYQIEIDTQDYNFNRAQIEVDVLKTIVKNDIVKFYDVSIWTIKNDLGGSIKALDGPVAHWY